MFGLAMSSGSGLDQLVVANTSVQDYMSHRTQYVRQSKVHERLESGNLDLNDGLGEL